VQRALLTVRPWRLAPPPKHEAERPMWQTIAVLYACLAVIVGIVTGLAFLAASLFG
jgi:heme/copper-type cytochrome/quinol oxidase subunit 2